MLDSDKISRIMTHSAEVFVFEEIDSTNSEAKRRAVFAAENGNFSPILILAKSQSAGRGRMGRSFLSRADSGIYMSLLYFTDKPLSDAVSVTTAAAAFVAEEIERVTDSPMKIKWVNDVYSDRGKVAGILVESVPVSSEICGVIVGIGINTGEDDFPEELQGIAASIGNVCGKEEKMVASIADRLLAHADAPDNRDYMDAYRKRFMLSGERVCLIRCGEDVDEGTVIGVDDDGGLLFIPDRGSEAITIRSGEVSVRKIK